MKNKAGRKKGCVSWNKGIACSNETRQKISKANKGQIAWNKDRIYKQIRGKNHYNWKGGRKITKDGYILIYQPEHPHCDANNYIPEHRLVIEQQIGRYLLPEEVTHHLRARDDNRLYMLMVFVSNSAHQRFHYNPNNVKPKEIVFDGRKLLNNPTPHSFKFS